MSVSNVTLLLTELETVIQCCSYNLLTNFLPSISCHEQPILKCRRARKGIWISGADTHTSRIHKLSISLCFCRLLAPDQSWGVFHSCLFSFVKCIVDDLCYDTICHQLFIITRILRVIYNTVSTSVSGV